MKQLVLCVVVMMAFVFAPALQAQVRGIDKAQEMNQKIEAMRAQLAADGHTFEIGMNPAMNYSLDQLCTLDPSLASNEDIAHENSENGLSYAMALPSSYTGYSTPVKNQGSCGSCWAFGIIGTIEGTWKKVLGSTYDFSEQHLMDCDSYGYGCNGGWFTAFNDITYPNYFKWESCCPYVGADRSCSSCSSCSNADYVSNWYYVGNSYSIPSCTAIKQKIYDYGSVTAAVYADYYFQAYSSGCFSETYSGSGVNHAIILCGWDAYGCLKLKNSWGTGWGENGYMWIKCAANNVGYAACYAVY